MAGWELLQVKLKELQRVLRSVEDALNEVLGDVIDASTGDLDDPEESVGMRRDDETRDDALIGRRGELSSLASPEDAERMRSRRRMTPDRGKGEEEKGIEVEGSIDPDVPKFPEEPITGFPGVTESRADRLRSPQNGLLEAP